MKKLLQKLLLISLVLLLTLSSSGCKDYMDIDKKLINTTVAFDYKDGQVWIYSEIADTKGGGGKSGEQGGGSGGKYKVYKAQGKTVVEARHNLDMELENKLYISSLTTLILSESFAKEHLLEYLNRLEAQEEYRKKVITVITKEDPEKLLKLCNDKDSSAGETAAKLLKTLDKSGKSFQKTTARLIENLNDVYTGILIPCIGIENEHISLAGYSVISGSKVTDFIPESESKPVVYLKAEKPKFSYNVLYKDVNYTVEIELDKRKIKPSYQDNKISYDVTMSFKAQINYGNKKIPYHLDDKAYEEMGKIISGMMEQETTAAIKHAQTKYKCDYLQFDDYFRVKYPVQFEKLEKNWAEEFSKATVKVSAKTKVSTTWSMDFGKYQLR